MADTEIDGKKIRVDFSITKRPHTPTPGHYMGQRTSSSYRGDSYRDRSYRRSPSPRYYRRSPSPYYRSRRSPSPYYRSRRSPSPYYRRAYRSRSRSYSPRIEVRRGLGWIFLSWRENFEEFWKYSSHEEREFLIWRKELLGYFYEWRNRNTLKSFGGYEFQVETMFLWMKK